MNLTAKLSFLLLPTLLGGTTTSSLQSCSRKLGHPRADWATYGGDYTGRR